MLLSPALPHDGLKELLLQLGPTARRSGKELISTEGGKEAEKSGKRGLTGQYNCRGMVDALYLPACFSMPG